MFYKTISLVFLFGLFSANAQQNDSITKIDSTSNHLKFNYKKLIIPSILIGYGVIGLESDQLLSFNSQIKKEVTEDIDEKITIDDFSQYAPAASVYALNAFGIKGKNNMRDRSVIFVTSYAIMATTILSLKSIVHEERPDGSSNNSFPSGHTATAFAGAEFLWQEYKDKSIWYGIAGYAVATGTGLFRIYNNRHWLTDVAAGAGIGILSTKLAYWMNPYITKKLFKSSSEIKSTSMVAPFYNGQQYGLSFVKVF
ncbi:phosphatase PAP2 family protein [Flavobacterium sp. ANB]|uniref:phosphatase PAP2 family protein n=1 Tax=unclassified Flavobacterium TaxID=196869 RepID=UPI0012BA0872|nr:MULTISPECIES: phosphatase PAP2 family protein [unclassified Flavobacterium]MBF4519266.1 phosphatase PAP2 family protein [Flavobacterium sp. ANB]MTD71930.1 phosphatase PAP2 family protein [Flavobacterium sp. LC2016-13]